MKKLMMAAAALFAVVSMASAVNLAWGGGMKALDESGNILDHGAAYLVYLGANGNMDTTFNGTTWEMGDDQIVQSDSIIDYGSSGSTGNFGRTYDTGDKKAGSKYVIIIAEQGVVGDSLPTTGFYGVSDPYTQKLSGAADPEQFDAANAGFSTIKADIPVVPEPTTYALVGLAAAAFALRKRFLKK